MRKLPPVLFALFLFTTFSFAQSVIPEAALYTVKIRTAVAFPFIGETKGVGFGSGFLIDRERGWVLTNAHVAKRSPSTLAVSFKDQPFVGAKKLFVDTHLDVAIIAVPPTALPAWATEAKLNCASEPEAGTSVIAFGHPWGLDYTATRRIISGTKFRWGAEQLQTDAALNPGNSGGPLISERSGQVVGINTSTLTASGAIHFAVPAPMVCTLVKLLRDGKDPAPPLLPISFANTNRESELVVATVQGNWAELIKVGDRIEAVNGDRTATDTTRVLDKVRGQSSVSFAILRGREHLTVVLPVPTARDLVAPQGLFVSGMLLSKSMVPSVDPALMFVHFVDSASAAQLAGFQSGDEILSVNGASTKSLNDLEKALSRDGEDDMEFVFRRKRMPSEDVYSYYARRLGKSDTKHIY
jgi:serine protease Do